MDFSARLKSEIDRLGMTQAEAAREAGLPDSQGLRDVLAGRKRLSAELLAALSTAGLDVLYVVTGERAGARGAEVAYIARETARREPSGEGPMHDLMSKTFRAMASETSERRIRLQRLFDRLCACSDSELDVLEPLIYRIAPASKSRVAITHNAGVVQEGQLIVNKGPLQVSRKEK